MTQYKLAFFQLRARPITWQAKSVYFILPDGETESELWVTDSEGTPHPVAGEYVHTFVNNVLMNKADLVGGKIPASQLPSYVDDVEEYDTLGVFPGTGETGKIYVETSTGKIYRWSGSIYVYISPSPGSTDMVPEGTTNLYFTNARVDSRLASVNLGGATTLGNSLISAASHAALIGVLALTAADIPQLAYSALSGLPSLATVATSGSYLDLSNRPALATVATTGAYSDLSGKPSLASVAISGSYTDLGNRPTLGTSAALDYGVSAGNLVRLDATTAKLPAVDGSLLSGLTVANISGLTTTTVAGRLAKYSNTTGSLSQTADLYEDSTGNVGIGTTNPSAKFAVVDGAYTLAFSLSGGLQVGTGAAPAGDINAGTCGINSVGQISWGLSGSSVRDVALYRDAASTLALKNSTNAQTFRVYNTYTDASNYERGIFSWSNNVLTIGTEAAGTGTVRNINFIGGNVGIGTTAPGAKVHAAQSGLCSFILGAGITNTNTPFAAVFSNDTNSGLTGAPAQTALLNTRAPTVGNLTALSFLGTGRSASDVIDYWKLASVITAIDAAGNSQTADFVFLTKPAGVYPNATTERMRITSAGNVGIGVNAFGTSAVGVLGIANGTAPSSSPAGMGQLYVESGALKYRGSSGTVTILAVA